MNFPHLDDTPFPNLESVDVYKFENTFDYSRFDNVQMIIRVLNVPWDLGEVHVGNRTVGGIGNVVKFESDDARDAWFNSKRYAETPEQAASGNYDGFVWSTQYREFHDEDEIYIPLPFDVAARYNYITIEYMPAPTGDYPVDYESARGLLKWFYFSRAVESEAVNTTRCIVRRDTWQTYINRVNIPYMILDRGHAPMAAAASVEQYLNSPIENNRYLLAPDVDYNASGSKRVSSSSSIVLNAECYYACIATTADVAGVWGTDGAATWTTPARVYNTAQGQLSANVFAIRANRIDEFLNNINANIPQFIQTIQAVFFASRELVELGNQFSFGGETCHWLVEKNNRKTLFKLNKTSFGFDSQYANLAKLYTFPYSHILIADDSGNVSTINVEETNGTVELDFKLSFAYPWLNIEGHLLGVGASSSQSITFSNLEAHTFALGGSWFEHLKVWQIPTFAITQSARDVADYSTFYDRAQGYLENSTALANALDQNSTTLSNALDQNATTLADSLASANANYNNTADAITLANDNASDNRALQNTMNDYSNNLIDQETGINLGELDDNVIQDLSLSIVSTELGNEAAAMTNVSSAVGSQFQGGGFSAPSMTGSGMGGISDIANMAISRWNSIVGGIIGTVNLAIALSRDSTIAAAAAAVGIEKLRITKGAMELTRDARISFNNNGNRETLETAREIAFRTRNVNNSNNTRTLDTETTNANRDKATADGIANRDKATADAIANRDKATADAAIIATFDQAALNSPFEFGAYVSGETSTTRPLGMFANIVTQPRDAIAQAGDYFLKYGYAYKGNWNFETFNVMPKFSYWRCDDLTVRGLDVPDLYMDEIRFFLLGGVTVWRRPEDIGNVSIYENE